MAASLHRLPRGPHKLSREEVVASQRTRLLRAFTELLAERGYAGVRIGELATRAGVSRATFYEQFDDKEACLLKAFEAFASGAMEAVTAPLDADVTPRDRAIVLLTRYLAFLDDDLVAARAFFSEMIAAGPEARLRRREVSHAFADLIAAQHAEIRDPSAAPLPPLTYLALALAVRQLVAEQLQTESSPRLVDLVEPLSALFVATLQGADTALP